MEGLVGIIIVVILGLLGVWLYFLPFAIASEKRNAKAIFFLNLFLGWTLVGWVVALVWANMEEDEDEDDEKENDFKKCPYCAERIKKEAIVCRFCQRDIVADAPEESK